MMKRQLGYIALSIAAILLQKFLENYASVDSISPKLIILVAVYFALREGKNYVILRQPKEFS